MPSGVYARKPYMKNNRGVACRRSKQRLVNSERQRIVALLRLVSIEQLAKTFRVSTRTIYNIRKEHRADPPTGI